MLNAQELKSRLTESDIKKIISILDGVIFDEDDDKLILNTICHGGDSPNKLYIFKNNNNTYDEKFSLYCFTCCGSFDIIDLVCKVKDYSFTESLRWIAIQLGFSTNNFGFGESEARIKDWEFINNLIRRKNKKNTFSQVDFYDRDILNIFQKMYLKEWINEGISVESMLKYEISYSTLLQKVIIPHFDRNYGLLGIRTRNIIEEEIELYGKYNPLQLHGKMYNHPIGQNLYGLHINEKTIKRKRKIMLVEGEKSVLQCDTYFGEDNFTVALCGSNLSNFQRDLILSLGVDEVIIALDKQFEKNDDIDSIKWAKHIKEKFINKLSPYCKTTVLWDTEDLLPYKASPTDKGKETLLKLMEDKIYVTCD